MASCESWLWDVVRSIEPTPSQKDGAQRSHLYLRNLMKTGQMEKRITTDFLSGSYSRNTAIRPLDDVDIIFVVDPMYWAPRPNLARTLFLGTPSEPVPALILESFAGAIRYRYSMSSVFVQRRSVRLQLYHLDIDVVPAIRQGHDPALLRIPDTEADRWIATSPFRHSANAAAANKFQNGMFKPLVKLLKRWNGNLPSTANFKSFAIETLAAQAFKTNKFNSLQEGLLKFFDFVAYASGEKPQSPWFGKCGVNLGLLGPVIPDAAGTGSNTASGADKERQTRFVAAAVRSRDRMAMRIASRLDRPRYEIGRDHSISGIRET